MDRAPLRPRHPNSRRDAGAIDFELLRRGRAGRDVFFKVAEEQGVEVVRGVRAFVYGVGAVGILHEVYWLIEFDEAI